MKTKLVSVFVVAAIFPICGALGQPSVVMPSSPAPVVTAAAPASAPNQVVYSARLPSAAELTSAAAAQGLTIDKIEQNAAQVTVSYKNSTGQTNIVSYQTLPSPGGSSAPVVVMPSNPTPAPVIVEQAPSVVYYGSAYGYRDSYYSYASPYWYPPVSFGFGLNYGFRGGYSRGFVGGGFRHFR